MGNGHFLIPDILVSSVAGFVMLLIFGYILYDNKTLHQDTPQKDTLV